MSEDQADAAQIDDSPETTDQHHVSDEADREAVPALPEASEVDAEPADDDEADDPDALTFASLGLTDKVLKAVKDLGYETPSPIQAETIPVLLEGRDVVGLAQTGTGKTAAFALPILNQLDPRQKAPQALVLAPTRELALQVCEAFESYAGHLKGVRVLPVYGGQGYGVQLSALARGVHVVVGTPGRIMDHLDRGTLDLSELRFLVLDEADEMLSMGFTEDVEHILAATPDDKQVALFSATMPRQIKKLAETYLTDPAEIVVQGKTRTAANVSHRYLIVAYPQKVDALTRILEVENFEGLIVFVRTKHETETLAEKLRARGFSASAINGDMPQAARERTINQLKAAKLDILVATDVAARGLDVDRISHVVNFDIPTDTESYVHRIGRTGRAGRSGAAISFVTPRERHLLRAIERATGQELTAMKLPTADDINATRLSNFDESISAALGNTESINFFRDVVSHYVDEYDVPELDVAAALAAVLQGDEPMLLDPADDPSTHEFRDKAGRRDRDDRFDGERGGRPDRAPRTSEGLVAYRIEVGHRQKITPRHIVGALANEGGLQRSDFGRIDIRKDYSLVELPEQLSDAALEKLAATRISGKLIELQRDRGPKAGSRFEKRDRFDKGDRRGGRDDRRGGFDDRKGGFGGRDRDDRGYEKRGRDKGGRSTADDRGGRWSDRGTDRKPRWGERDDRGGRGHGRDDRRPRS